MGRRRRSMMTPRLPVSDTMTLLLLLLLLLLFFVVVVV